MRIIKNPDKKAKIKIPPNSRVPIETSDSCFTHHALFLVLGKRGSGKSVLITNYLRMMKAENKADRIIVISPTIDSNRALLDSLDIQDEDVFDPDSPTATEDVVAIINEERDQYQEELERLKRWKKFEKLMSSNIPIESIDPYLFLEFCDSTGQPVAPRLKYGHRPMIHCFVDDCQSSRIFRDKKFLNMVIRHRHIGGMRYVEGDPECCGAIGCSLYIAIQNLKATQGGCPRAIRNNATQFAIVGKTKDEQELKDVYSSIAGEIEYDDFCQAYEAGTDDRHNSLIIDFHPKRPEYRFRKNLDTFLDVRPAVKPNELPAGKA